MSSSSTGPAKVLIDLASIPRLSFAQYPTPLEEMPRLRGALGENSPRLFVKRDDYTGLGFGGNKVRKLEYALARELANETTTVVTVGGEKSNHARITAAACARLGIKCVLVLNRAGARRTVDEFVPASRFSYERFGAEVVWVSRREDRDPTARTLVHEMQEKGAKAQYLPLGLSVPIGAIGYVNAYLEVARQSSKLKIRPQHIFISSSSGGTQAGLVAARELFGDVPAEVTGVSPDDPEAEIAEQVAAIASGVFDELGIKGKLIRPSTVTVTDRFIGGGYGVPTPESLEAEDLFARYEGIMLDPLYTSKAAAAMIDAIRNGKFDRDAAVMFWHTGGQLANFYAPQNEQFHNRISGDKK